MQGKWLLLLLQFIFQETGFTAHQYKHAKYAHEIYKQCGAASWPTFMIIHGYVPLAGPLHFSQNTSIFVGSYMEPRLEPKRLTKVWTGAWPNHRNLQTDKFKFQIQVISGAFFQESNVLMLREGFAVTIWICIYRTLPNSMFSIDQPNPVEIVYSLLLRGIWQTQHWGIHKSSVIANQASRNKRPLT